MLRSVNDLKGYAIEATDGEVGEVVEFYFDDEKWTVRYLVADTGGWLNRTEGSYFTGRPRHGGLGFKTAAREYAERAGGK